MIATLIAVVSLAALVQIFISYCQSVLASAGKVELSSRVVALTGMEGATPAAGDFDRVLQLVRLCPTHDADRTGVRAIVTYYRLVQYLGRVIGPMYPHVIVWAGSEGTSCSHFASVVLDRCISSSRSLFAEQAGDHL
jgi:hypothetical protein